MVTTRQEVPTIGSLLDFRALAMMREKGFLGALDTAWHEKGDLFALQIANRKLVFAIHPNHVQYINISNAQNYSKEATYELTRKLLMGNGLLPNRGEFWRRQRRLMAPFFTPRGIEAFYAIMINDTAELAARWERTAAAGGIVDVEVDMNKLAASIILHSMFSVNNEETTLEIKQAIETMIAYVNYRTRSPLALPRWIPTNSTRKYNDAYRRVHTYIDRLIAERQQIPEDEYPDDLLSKLLLTRDEETGKRMSYQQVHDEAVTIFIAGHETTARTMLFVWYLLSQHPETLQQLQAEIDSTVQGDTPTIDELKQIGYTLRVIKETLRLFPAIPIYVRDALNDDVIDGYHIPAGTGVYLPLYFTHRHPDFWDDPEHFDPMRFSPENEKAQHPYQYHPFAAGQRICLGNNFSLMESQVILAVLAKQFVLTPVDGYEFKLVVTGTLGVANRLPMQITHR